MREKLLAQEIPISKIPRVVPNSGKWKEGGCSLREFEALIEAVKGLRIWCECPPGVDLHLQIYINALNHCSSSHYALISDIALLFLLPSPTG